MTGPAGAGLSGSRPRGLVPRARPNRGSPSRLRLAQRVRLGELAQDPAVLRRAGLAALSAERLKVARQGSQGGDLASHLVQPLVEQAIGVPAGVLRIAPHGKKLLDLVERHAEGVRHWRAKTSSPT